MIHDNGNTAALDGSVAITPSSASGVNCASPATSPSRTARPSLHL